MKSPASSGRRLPSASVHLPTQEAEDGLGKQLRLLGSGRGPSLVVGLDPDQTGLDAVDLLVRTPGMTREPALVELGGDELADRRVQSPALGEEHAPIGSNGRLVTEDVLQHARPRTAPGGWLWRPEPAAVGHPAGSRCEPTPWRPRHRPTPADPPRR